MLELNLFGLFLSSFLAATVFPMPSELHLAALSNIGYSSVSLFLAASVGNSLGSFLTYFMGYFCKWELIEKYFKVKREKIVNFQLRVSKRIYIWSLLVWVPIVGDLLCLTLGFLKTPKLKTFIFITLGKMLRYAVVIYLIGKV